MHKKDRHPWYYPLMVDSEKRPHGMMRSTLLTGGDFLMPPRKGQKQQQYDEATKSEAVRLRVEEHWSYPMIMEKLGIKSKTQIREWVQKRQNGETFEDYRGRWIKKYFSSLEEENNYLKAQVEYLKKLNPNLHGEGSWISKPGLGRSKK